MLVQTLLKQSLLQTSTNNPINSFCVLTTKNNFEALLFIKQFSHLIELKKIVCPCLQCTTIGPFCAEFV